MEDDFAPREKTQTANKALSAGVATVAFAGAGLYVFISGIPWFESGQYILISLFILCLGLLFFGIFRMRIPLAVISAILGIGLLFGAYQKFTWRKAYLQDGLAGKAFILDPFIRDYPSLESYLVAPWIGLPDWVRFARDCITPVRSGGQPTSEGCLNADSIQKTYHIDVKAEILAYRARMARTADMISKGKLGKKQEYQNCIARKDCAEVPLLPKEVDPETIDPESNDYLPVRRMFWQLVNEKTMTPELCSRILLCAVLAKMGAVSDVGN